MDPLTAISIGQGAVGLVSGLFGANRASKERARAEQYLNQRESENTAWYNANALGDYTQRADSQALLRNLRENLTRQNRRAENMAIVTGATPEQQAMQKEQSNQVIADTYSRLGAMGQQYKDRVTDRYFDMKNSLANQRMSLSDAKARNYETLFSNGLGVFSSGLGTLAKSFMPIPGAEQQQSNEDE